MKQCFLAVSLFMVSAVTVAAQNINDVFNEQKEITWLGLDFTATRLIGDEELWQSTENIRKIMESMNTLMLSESPKYDVAGALGRPNVNYQLEVTLAHNSDLNISMDNMFTTNVKDHFLKPADIQEIVNTYDFKGLTGLGLMINIESLSKVSEQGTLWITFINLGTKEVLFTEKMIEPPSGFGLRNYWASTVYRAIKEIKAGEYVRWRKKYYRKTTTY